MDISEMHVWFRQYAQQMGMQNYRALLPEQIDILINTSINDITNSILKEHLGSNNDRVVTDNSKIGQINDLSSLYKVALIELSPNMFFEEKRLFNFKKSDAYTGKLTTNFNKIGDSSFPNFMRILDFSISYKKVLNKLGYTGKDIVTKKDFIGVLTPDAVISGTEDYNNIVEYKDEPIIEIETFVLDNEKGIEDYIPVKYKLSKINTNDYGLITITKYNNAYQYLGVEGIKEDDPNYGGKHYVLTEDFSDGDADYNDGIIYNPVVLLSNKIVSDYISPTFDDDSYDTNFFPIRMIDDVYLSDALNDFIQKPRLRSPIIVTYNNNNTDKTFDLYIEKFNKHILEDGTVRYVLNNDLLPYILRMSYIAKPAVVKKADDLGGDNVDCDLPEYMHIPILKHAVDLYRISVSGSLQATQQQEQTAQQENMRNNYRNEGNG